MKRLLAAVVVAVVSSAQAGVVIHVDAANCPGPGDGSALDPYCSIQAAIDAAADTDEIVVAAGTYAETADLLGKAITLHSADGPDVTIIDGQQLGAVVTCAGGEGPDTILEGFTITGGAGRGMFNAGSSPTVTQCTFLDQPIGIENRFGAEPFIDGCTFTGHEQAMYNFDGASPLVVDCLFEDNDTGMENQFCTLTIVDCSFNTNGIGIYSNNSDLTVLGCVFTGNTAGGMTSWSSNQSHDVLVVDCSFIDNTQGTSGAGMHNAFVRAVVLRCVFAGNATLPLGSGGAISSSLSNGVVIANCLFRENAARFGGAISNGGSSAAIANCDFLDNAADYGAAIYNLLCSPVVTNCTVSGNTAGPGAGAVHSQGAGAAPSLANCIVWGNSPQAIFDTRGAAQSVTTVRYSIVEGGWAGMGDHNIDADPLFADPVNGDVRLQPGSPAIDAGANWGVARDVADLDDDGDTSEMKPLDLDGNPRFADDPGTEDSGCGVPVVVDMGAHEFQGDPATVVFGDLNGDGIVTIADLIALNRCMGSSDPACCVADLNFDGVVGPADARLLMQQLIHKAPLRRPDSE